MNTKIMALRLTASSIILGVTATQLLCTGCNIAPGNDYTIYIDPDNNNPGMTEEILFSLNEWETAVQSTDEQSELRFHVIYGYGEECTHCMFLHAVSTSWLQNNQSADLCDGKCIGWTNLNKLSDSSLIFLSTLDGQPSTERQTMITHEIGHGLGLKHPDSETPPVDALPGSQVMMPNITTSAMHVMCEDVQQYRKVRGQQVPSCEVEGGSVL